MRRHLARALPALVLLICLPLALAAFSRLLGPRADEEALSPNEDVVRQAAVQCYALEGAYPAGVDHLKEYYGVAVDESRCRIDYVYIGSNLMPDITVVPLGDGS